MSWGVEAMLLSFLPTAALVDGSSPEIFCTEFIFGFRSGSGQGGFPSHLWLFSVYYMGVTSGLES